MNLKTIWKEQEEYNKQIFQLQGGNFSDRERNEWAKNYLLGMISEVDEVLNTMNWKRHKQGTSEVKNRNALAFELADLTKYIICLWQNFGFSDRDMLNAVASKTDFMNFMFHQEFSEMPRDENILIVDIDNCLVDWEKSFAEWVEKTTGEKVAPVETPHFANFVAFEQKYKISFESYSQLKDQFEMSGQYRTADPLMRNIMSINYYEGRKIIFTARPKMKFKNIAIDTYEWLIMNRVYFSELHFGYSERIEYAIQLSNNGNRVTAIDDNPELISRLSQAGIPVIAIRQPYNKSLEDSKPENVTFTDELSGKLVSRT